MIKISFFVVKSVFFVSILHCVARSFFLPIQVKVIIKFQLFVQILFFSVKTTILLYAIFIQILDDRDSDMEITHEVAGNKGIE